MYTSSSRPSMKLILHRIIYRSMKSQLRKLDGISPEIDELAVEAVDDAAEGAPLLLNHPVEDDDDHIRPGVIRLEASRASSPAV